MSQSDGTFSVDVSGAILNIRQRLAQQQAFGDPVDQWLSTAQSMAEFREEGLDEEEDGYEETKVKKTNRDEDEEDAEMTPVHPGHPAGGGASAAAVDAEGDTQVVPEYDGDDDQVLGGGAPLEQLPQEEEAQEPELFPPLFVPPDDVFATKMSQPGALIKYISDPKEYLQRWNDVRLALGFNKKENTEGYSNEGLFAGLFSALVTHLDGNVGLLRPDVFKELAKTADDVLCVLSTLTLFMRHIQPNDTRVMIRHAARVCGEIRKVFAQSAAVAPTTEEIEREGVDRVLLYNPSGSKGVLSVCVQGPLVFGAEDILHPPVNRSHAGLSPVTIVQLAETVKQMPDTTGRSPTHMLAMCMNESLLGKADRDTKHPLLDALRCDAILLEAKKNDFQADFKGAFEALLEVWPLPESGSSRDSKPGGEGKRDRDSDALDADFKTMQCLAASLDLCTMFGAFPWRARFPKAEMLAFKCVDRLARMISPVNAFEEVTALRAANNVLRLLFAELEPSRYREYDNVPELVKDKEDDKGLLSEIKEDEKKASEAATAAIKAFQAVMNTSAYQRVPRFILYLATTGQLFGDEFKKQAPLKDLSPPFKPDELVMETALLRSQLAATVLAVLQPQPVKPIPLWLRWPFAGQKFQV